MSYMNLYDLFWVGGWTLPLWKRLELAAIQGGAETQPRDQWKNGDLAAENMGIPTKNKGVQYVQY